MKLEIYPSASGDCVLLTSRDGKRLLADAALPDAYEEFIARPLSLLRAQKKTIDVAYVSHIDRDHIGGILRILDHEMKWRVFDHMTKKGRKFKQPKVPRPPEIREIWHNAFLEDLEETRKIDVGAALASSANALAMLNAGGLGDARTAALTAEVEMLALSVGDAIEVNWRIGKKQLDIPLNRSFDGGFMVARPKKPIRLGSLTITVLGPTAKQLKVLKDEWIAWLKAKEDYVEKLRKAHDRDAGDLRSGMPPRDIAELTRSIVLAVEKDLTPPNLASLVLLVEEDGKRVLLTGDAGDESLLEYLDDAGLLDSSGGIELDVLKVPHHGAHNSFSPKLASRVRASNYIFCGDGEHHNPEPDVVQGYLDAIGQNPMSNGKTSRFWFNWSKVRATAHRALWTDIDACFKPGKVPANVERRSLGKNDTLLEFEP